MNRPASPDPASPDRTADARWAGLNALLQRQLHKAREPLDPADPAVRAALQVVSATYDEMQQELRHFEHVLSVVSDELTEVNERIRREARQQLDSLDRRYQQTLELQQGMILCLRRTERGFLHTLCRGRLAARLGLSPAEVENRLVAEVAPAPQAARLNSAYERAWAGEEVSFEFTTSSDAELLVFVRPRFEEGEVCEIIASCVEISARKDAERALVAAKERAESADRAKSEFLAVMSHEIRTPLNAVLGLAQLLRDSPLDAEQRQWVDTMLASGASLTQLIEDILDYSRIEAGRLELNFSECSPAELLQTVTGMLRPRAAAKDLRLELVPDLSLPARVVTDAVRLRQVFVNLLGNAIKFTRSGAVQVSSRTVPLDDRTVLLRFEISDTGIGIEPGARERLFRSFSQADSSTTRIYGGTGLGLVICKRLVNALGGDIDFESTPGTGTTFFFTIRAELAPGSSPAAAPAGEDRRHLAAGLHVLVAEANAINRRMIEQMLERFGCRVLTAGTGLTLVELAKSQLCDLMMLDLALSGLDVIGLAAEIRRRQPAPPRIVVLTSNPTAELRARCKKAGIDDIVAKPVKVSDLENQLLAVAANGRPKI